MDASACPGGTAPATGREYAVRAPGFFLFDRAIALAILFALAPLLVVTALCIVFVDPGPVLFSHRRIGFAAQTFGCLKFRTMVVNADRRLAELLERDAKTRLEWQRDHKLRSDPRITPLGRFLRKSSIDELPQLINLIRRDMRIVGPRPIVSSEVEKYGRFFAYYASVVPGITGLWQVTGRNDVSYRRRVAADVFYVRHRCLLLDLRIMAATVAAVFTAKGTF